MTVCGQLYALGKAAGEVLHESIAVLGRALPDHPRGNEFGIRTNGGPGVDVTIAERSLEVLGEVLFLGVAEGPDFIGLNLRAGKVADGFVLVLAASLPEIREEFQNYALGGAGHTASRTNAVPFDKGRDNLCPLAAIQLVHTLNICLSGQASIVI